MLWNSTGRFQEYFNDIHISTSNIGCSNFDTKMLHCKCLILNYKITMRSLNKLIMVIRSHLQMWKTFCHYGGANSIKTNLQTNNLHLQVALLLIEFVPPEWLTFFPFKVKNFSRLQMDIFFYSNSRHSRRNVFREKRLNLC